VLRKIFLPSLLVILAVSFWFSADFKQIAAGVAIFLFGMLFLEDGFRQFSGGILERVLARTTNSLFKSISFGVVATSIMQSSSLVSIITISFLSAELIGLAAGIGIIFGANLGTTTGAWLIAGFGLKVKISAYAMPMLAFAIIFVFQKSKALKGIGYILAGLGLLFLGIHHMKDGFEAFRGTIDLAQYAMDGYLGLFVFTLIGIAATVIMQSSHATLVIIITALSVGQVSYENALALAIGANVGTTITAIIGSLSANYIGKRLAGAHLIFNLVTGALAIAFMAQLIWMVDVFANQFGIAPDDYTLKLAVFHTIFNTIGVLVMAPFVKQLVAFLERTMPAKEKEIADLKYLNDAALEFPETLVIAIRKEISYLYDNAVEIVSHGISLHRHVIYSDRDLEAFVKSDTKVMDLDIDEIYTVKVKSLYSKIIEYISRAQSDIPSEYSNMVYELRRSTQNIGRVIKNVKHLHKNISFYLKSDNEFMRREYNDYRLKIAKVLRLVNHIREGSEDVDVFDLDELRRTATTDNIINDGTLDELIRSKKITAQMATSLMNDYAYMEDIIVLLTNSGRVLFGEKGFDEVVAQEMLRLDENELEAISEEENVTT